jgi:drug/metabolite transporter (DMT)-like permease
MGESPSLPPNLVLLISVIAVSTASILIRWTDAPPLAIASYRMSISVIILAPFFVRNKGIEKLKEQGVRQLFNLLVIGVILAIHFASWITSLSLTSVASSVIFVHIDPIFVAIISHLFLGDKLTRRTTCGIVISFIGISIIAMGDAGAGTSNVLGDLLALIGGVMLGLYILGGRIYRKNLDLTSYVTPVYSVAAISLILMSLVTGTKLVNYSLSTYRSFFLIALIPMIFGHTLYNWSLRYLSAPVVSLSLLGEPIGASILAYLFLGEIPTHFTILGGIITLAGILISAYKNENTERNARALNVLKK